MRHIVIASLIAASLAFGIAACASNEMRQNGTDNPNGTLYPSYDNPPPQQQQH